MKALFYPMVAIVINSPHSRRLVLWLLTQLATRTDNQLDDELVAAVRQALDNT